MNIQMTAEKQAAYKAAAADTAVLEIRSGMRVGLGTGSTAIFATRRIAALIKEGVLRDILCFATSRATRAEAAGLGIPLMADELPSDLDLTIDGADEVTPDFNVIKGGGGALLREKVVAQASKRVIIVVDESKLSPMLGTLHTLPVEVLEYGSQSQWRFLEHQGARIQQRYNTDTTAFLTDSGNLVFDCDFGPIEDPIRLAGWLNQRAGIVEHGLFLGLATDVVVAGPQGTRQLRR